MAHASNAFWLKFFIQNEINVLTWNYRSYGRSEGTPDPFCTYHDGEAMLKFLIDDLGLTGKFGCFGRSLGGTIATYVACNHPRTIDLLMVDRSLGSLQKMSEGSFLGKWTPFIFEIFTQGWKVNSDENYYQTKCFKMIT